MGLRSRIMKFADGGSTHIYYLDGKHVPGVTTVVGNVGGGGGLVKWAGECAALYAFDHRDELGTLGREEYVDLVSKAADRTRDEAARAGSDVHTIAHALLGDEPVQVPAHLRGHIDQTIDFLERWGVEDLLAEVMVGNRRYGYAGRLDLIARLRDGRIWLLDYKTGRSVWRTVALQLAGYRYAEFYVEQSEGEEHELPEVDACGVVHIGSDSWELVPVRAGMDEFRDFVRAVPLHSFLKRKDLIGSPLERPSQTSVLTHSGSDVP